MTVSLPASRFRSRARFPLPAPASRFPLPASRFPLPAAHARARFPLFRTSKLANPPTTPAASTVAVSAGVHTWVIPSSASIEYGPGPTRARPSAPVAYSSGSSMPFDAAKTPFGQ